MLDDLLAMAQGASGKWFYRKNFVVIFGVDKFAHSLILDLPKYIIFPVLSFMFRGIPGYASITWI